MISDCSSLKPTNNPPTSTMLNTSNAKKGFTLIELLTVVAILAILGAIIFPTVGQFRTLAKKTSDSSDLRNIVQASQLFAAQNGERLVGQQQELGAGGVVTGDGDNDIVDIAAILAYGGELTDPKTWVSANELNKSAGSGGLFKQQVDETTNEPIPGAFEAGDYSVSDFSFSYVTGLQTSDPATTPVAFTRMTTLAATWGSTDPYGNDGGHVAFLGGNVAWYEELTGELIAMDGDPVDTIGLAIPNTEDIRQPTVN